MNYVTDDFRTLVQKTYKGISDTFSEKFTFSASDGKIHKTSAQMCITKDSEWAISSGYHQGVLFVYNRPTSSLASQTHDTNAPDSQSHKTKSSDVEVSASLYHDSQPPDFQLFLSLIHI